MKRLLSLLLVMEMAGCGPSKEESLAALEELGAN